MKSDPPDIVRTEMLCQWVDTLDSPFPPGVWADAYDSSVSIVAGRPTWLGIDVTPDRRDPALIACQLLDDDETMVVHVLDTWHADNTIDDLAIAGTVAQRARDLEARVVGPLDRLSSSARAELDEVHDLIAQNEARRA